MGDDFDLFPKRENLDPFSFGKKEKSTETEGEKKEAGDDLFGQPEQSPGSLPDLPIDVPSEPAATPSVDSPSLPDLPLGGPEIPEPPPPAAGLPPVQPPPPSTPPVSGQTLDPMDGILSEGPISEEKTFDEPVFEHEHPVEDMEKRSGRKSPSPFVVVGGALIIIIGLLYGALTYLKRDKPSVPTLSAPPVSVAVVPPAPEPVPVPEPEKPEVAPETEVPTTVENEPAARKEPAGTEAQTSLVEESPKVAVTAVSKPEPVQEPAPVVPTGDAQYSIQVGAFILNSSVAELEKKLRGSGYDPILKKGSTTAMMNMLVVGPFSRVEDARGALSRLKDAGVDSNMRRRDDGGAIINAGSYLLEENATSVSKKIRSLGYPVKLLKREASLPMTFVRVGRYAGIDEANSVKEEMKGKGLEGIVVKLQQ